MTSTNQLPDKFLDNSDIENFQNVLDITEPSDYDFDVATDAFESIENYFSSDLDYADEFNYASEVTEHLLEISNDYLEYPRRNRENTRDIKRMVKRLNEIMELIPYWSSRTQY
jgi:hypothetical protein